MLKLAAQPGIIFLFLIAFLISGCELFGNKQKKEEEIERTYTKTIERNYSNEFERALIDSAEAAYPPRDSVLKAAPEWFKGNIPQTGYWFYSAFDGVLLPYSITEEAVHYYSDIIDTYNEFPEEQIVTKAHFTYKANISFEEKYEFHKPEEWPESIWGYIDIGERDLLPDQVFQKVYVVNMYLDWYSYCSPVCALYITQLRIVLFNESGDLIGIFLDGNWLPVQVS